MLAIWQAAFTWFICFGLLALIWPKNKQTDSVAAQLTVDEI